MLWWEEVKRAILGKKSQSLLQMGLACLLLLCLELYMGNIQSNQTALWQAGQELPVEVKVVSTDGSQDVGIRIEENKLEGLLDAGVKNPVYSVQIAGNVDPVNQVEPVKACDTSLYGVNSLEGFSFVEEDSFTFAPGYDQDFVEGQKAICAISTSYAATYGIELGDSLDLPVYSIEYDRTGYSFQFGSLGTVSLKVVGIFQERAGGQSVVNGIVPIGWVHGLFEENSVPFFYHSFQGLVEHPLELNGFKSAVEKLGFREINPTAADPRTGNALEIQDRVFRETAERLMANIQIFQRFAPAFCVLIGALVMVTTFFILRSTRREIAIASALGKPLLQSGGKLLLEHLLLTLVGSGIAVAFSAVFLGAAAIKIGLVFVGVSVVGSMGAVVLVCRFNVLEILTKQEGAM